jgi:hypothetical protein
MQTIPVYSFLGLFLFCAEDGGGGAGERWEGQLHVYA